MHADIKRTRWMGKGLFLAFAIAAGSQAWLQIVRQNEVIGLAKENSRYVIKRIDFAKRGTIYSSDDKVLAQSVKSFILGLNFQEIPKTESFFLALSEASGIPAAEFMIPASSGGVSKVWRQKISAAKAERIREVKTHWRANGVSLESVPVREYPYSDSVSNIVGKLEEDTIPTGLESSKNELLAGKDGSRVGLVDRKGAFLPMRMSGDDVKAMDGEDIELTIDTNVQLVAQAALKQAVEINKAQQGIALVIETESGNILASASFIRGTKEDKDNGFDPIVMGRFEPGSTFKILTLAEAMDHGDFRDGDTITCNGSMRISGRTISCDHGGHGVINGKDAIAESCNVSASTWALRVGYKDFTKFLAEAGLMKPSGVGLPGEIGGTYFHEKDFKNQQLQLANMGFGQGLNTTPMTLVAAFNAIANDGILVKPRLIRSIGKTNLDKRDSKRLFTKETSEYLQHYMLATFEADSGTAKGLRIPGLQLGGKTGTAEKLRKGSREDRPEYVSNFVGFIPAINPKATVLVMIDNPRAGQYYGASVAGPVFKEIADRLAGYFNIKKTKE